MTEISLQENLKSQKDLKFFTSEEVLESATEYFKGDTLAASTWSNKYALKCSRETENDRSSQLEVEKFNYLESTPDDMHHRIAKELYRIDLTYPNPLSEDKYYEVLKGFRQIVPQGSPMFGIGNPFVEVSLSNCVVVSPPEDSMSSIVETGKDLANLFKRRCGVGVSLDLLRPEGATVRNSSGTSTGAYSFANFYSNVCRMVGQNGRRGALMITMNILHPDVDKFATMKYDLTQVTGANISIMITDEFMKAVELDLDWVCRWPIDISVEEAKYTKTVKAREVWNLILQSATTTAEPGILFWDNYLHNLPAHCYPSFKTIAVNPCAELGLSANDSCRLVSINLKWFVLDPFTTQARFDFKEWERVVRIAMRIMDNIIDLEIECLNSIINSCSTDDEKILWSKLQKAAILGRRTGLGTHGLADCLARLCVRYDSSEAIEYVDKIYEMFRNIAYDESVNLAIDRGSFPAFDWELEKDNIYIKRLPQELQDRIARYGRRNISILTIAPTGSVSILSQTSSGIEPVFQNQYKRRKKINPSDVDAQTDFIDQNGDRWKEFPVLHHNVQDYLNSLKPDIEYSTQTIVSDSNNHLPLIDPRTLDKILPDYFVSSSEIDSEQRIRIQGTIQKYIDHGISSTINLPAGTTVETVSQVYNQAHKYGLKGVTVYVDGSRSGVLITDKLQSRSLSQLSNRSYRNSNDNDNDNDNDNRNTDDRSNNIIESVAPKRPILLPCDISKAFVQGQNWTILVGFLDGKPYEVFGGLTENIEFNSKYTTGKIRKCKCKKEEHLGKLSCYDLILGDDDIIIRDIANTFNNSNYGWGTRQISLALRHGVPIHFIVEQLSRDKDSDFTSFSRVMSRTLSKYITDGISSKEKCTDCKTKLIFQEGCYICPNCGKSKCD